MIEGYLPSHLQVDKVIDFGDLPVFDVAAYPAVVTGRKTTAPDPGGAATVSELVWPIRRALRGGERAVNVANVRLALEDLPDLIERAAAPNYPQVLLRRDGWILEDPVLVRLFDRLMSQGTPLNRLVHRRMYYGIKTGLNDAFVIDQSKRDELIAADPRSVELIKPWLRGKDIRRWNASWSELFVIFSRHGTDITRYPAIEAHLAQWRGWLEPRKAGEPATRKPRVAGSDEMRKPRKPGSYKWYEIQDNVAYYAEFEQPKIVWPDLFASPRFCWDEAGYFTANTVYQCIGAGPTEVAILNSDVAFFILSSICPSVRGGYLRLFSQYLALFPIPEVNQALRVHLEEDARSGVESETYRNDIDEAFGITGRERRSLDRWVGTRQEASLEDEDVEEVDDDE